jgi:endonuclease/exonuclease/phosphatase family metal-dependent hydrolase
MGDFNTPPSPTYRLPKQKIKKEILEILELNHTIGQMDRADVYRIFHPTSAQYAFFSAAHGTFSKTDHL